jgi:hypothetical protein
MPPFVIDIFALDVMSEMIHSPLQFLSYINRRVQYYENIMASNEITILSYHLQQNLWIDSKYNMMLLEDNIGVDLDIAMMVRREGLPGKATPDGILTRINDTAVGNLIREIENLEDPGIIELGLMLLQLNEDTIIGISKGIETIAKRARNDGKHHDFSISIVGSSTGLTIHCNSESVNVAAPSLQRHCEKRKYFQKSKSWFGVCINPNSLSLKFGLELDFEWKWSKNMEDFVRSFSKGHRKINCNIKEIDGRKISRNDPCPCGSGIKYKKCCINKNNAE